MKKIFIILLLIFTFASTSNVGAVEYYNDERLFENKVIVGDNEIYLKSNGARILGYCMGGEIFIKKLGEENYNTIFSHDNYCGFDLEKIDNNRVKIPLAYGFGGGSGESVFIYSIYDIRNNSWEILPGNGLKTYGGILDFYDESGYYDYNFVNFMKENYNLANSDINDIEINQIFRISFIQKDIIGDLLYDYFEKNKIKKRNGLILSIKEKLEEIGNKKDITEKDLFKIGVYQYALNYIYNDKDLNNLIYKMNE